MVFVTGATGILGRIIVLELLKKGVSVRAAKRPQSNIQEVKSSYRYYVENSEELFSNIEWVDVDFDDISSLEKALEGITEVYHCAAKVSFNPNDEKEMYHTNVEGTKNLLYACEDSQVQKFLYVSSIAVLDLVNEKGELDEDSDFNPKIDHSAYAITKHLAEMEVWRASAEGLNTIIINPGIIVGSGNWDSSSGELFSTFEKNKYTFSGGSAYVDVRDVANIAVLLMEKNTFGQRYIVLSENCKYETIGNYIRRALRLSNSVLVSPEKLKLGVFLNNVLGWAIPKLRLATSTNVKSVSSFSWISNKKIKEELSYEFIQIDDSIDFHLKNYINDNKSK